jgi:hypothetical protein
MYNLANFSNPSLSGVWPVLEKTNNAMLKVILGVIILFQFVRLSLVFLIMPNSNGDAYRSRGFPTV